MSQENVETVYRLYAASRRRDKEACVRDSDPDMEIVSYLMGIEGTVYSAPELLHVLLRHRLLPQPGGFEGVLAVHEVVDQGDLAVPNPADGVKPLLDRHPAAPAAKSRPAPPTGRDRPRRE
jgi:hypothetical protein